MGVLLESKGVSAHVEASSCTSHIAESEQSLCHSKTQPCQGEYWQQGSKNAAFIKFTHSRPGWCVHTTNIMMFSWYHIFPHYHL